MDRDRHDPGLVGTLLVKAVEVVDAAQKDLVRAMPLDGGDRHVIDLKRVGH